ncbi:MAG: immunoglobulin domain-containing protein [Phycisphaerales bacterium]|nr:immunoglobulin domain-containing protein [Phycisphaerales bacterium]
MRRTLSTSVVSLVAGAAVMGLGASAGGQCVWLNSPLPFSGTNPGFEGPTGLVTETPGGSSGAVGPNHVVTVEGSMVWMRRRTGFLIDVNPIQPPPPPPAPPAVDVNETLEAFFTSRANPALGLALSKVYGVSVRYDRVAQRWIVAGVGIDWNAPAANDYKVLLAVSDGDDPTGTWSVHAADADATNTRYPEHVTFGFNDQWIAIAANLYQTGAPYAFARNGMWVYQKSHTYSWVQPQTAVMDVGAMPGFGVRNGYESYAMRPAVSEDSSGSGALYIVDLYWAANGNGVPIYRLSKLEGPVDAPVWSCVPGSAYNATTGPEEIGWFNSGQVFSLAVPLAEQPGPTQLIATTPIRGTATVQDAVVRNGMLWFTNTGGMPAGGGGVSPDRSVVVWNRVSLGGIVPAAPDESGMVDGGMGVWHFAPSIAVNCRGDMAVGFTRSGVTEFASSAWAVRGAIDAPGTMRAVEVAKAGVSVYEEPGYLTPSAAVAPWGGWSSACVDTMDDQSFWTVAEYAEMTVSYGPPHNADGGLRKLWMEPVIAPVCVAPVVLSHPVAQSKCPGQSASFSVENSGSPAATYRWQRNGVNMSNGGGGGRYSGADTATVTIANVNSTDHNTSYRCVIENACGTVLTNGVGLTVYADVPGAPGNLTGSTGFCEVRLDWNAPGALFYNYTVYRSTTNNSASAVQIGSSLSNSHYNDVPPQPGVTYYYWVKASVVNTPCGEGAFSAGVLGSRVGLPPPPAGMTASDGTTCPGVQVSWLAVSGALEYQIFRNTQDAFPTGPAHALVPAGTTTYTDSSAVNNVTYYYWMKTRSQCGVSETVIGPDTGFKSPPPAPASITASNGTSCAGVTITWAGSAGATLYQVYRGTSGSFASAQEIGGGSAANYTDTSATPGVTYFYWVKAANDCGSSAAAAGPDQGWRTASPGATGLSATVINSCTRIRVAWTPAAGATAHALFRATANNFAAATQIATPAASPYTDTAVTAGQTYYYWIKETTSCGQSAEGSPVSVLLPAPVSIAVQPIGVDGLANRDITLSCWATGSPTLAYQWYRDQGGLGGTDPVSGSGFSGFNTATLTILNLGSTDEGEYFCRVTNGCNSVDTEHVLVTRSNNCDPPEIDTDTQGGTFCEGQSFTFLVDFGAFGGSQIGTGPHTYVWKKNGVVIPGAPNLWAYYIPSLSAADSGAYSVTVSNECGTYSAQQGTLVVRSPVVITTHPVGGAFCAGGSTTLTVAATGTPPLTYQWRQNGTPLGGETSSTLVIPSFGIFPNIDCVVTNACGSVTSNPAVFTEIATLVITGANDFTVPNPCPGTSTSITINHSGDGPFTYQWRKDGGPIPGATANPLVISSVTPADAGSYDCIVSNPCRSATTGARTLFVQAMPTITSHPESVSACSGPVQFWTTGTGNIQWRKDGVPIPGATGIPFNVWVSSAADAGVYDCVRSTNCGAVYSNPATLTVHPFAPEITTQPAGGTFAAGSDVSLTVAGVNTSQFRWYRNGVLIPGAQSATYTIPSATPAASGSYTCYVYGGCGGLTISSAAVVTVTSGADFNGSGTTTVQDLFDFLGAYFARDPRADVNGSGTWTVQDIFDYLGAYFRG